MALLPEYTTEENGSFTFCAIQYGFKFIVSRFRKPSVWAYTGRTPRISGCARPHLGQVEGVGVDAECGGQGVLAPQQAAGVDAADGRGAAVDQREVPAQALHQRC